MAQADGPTAVDVFRDLVASTSSTVFTSASDIINNAQRHNNYYTRFEHSGGDLSTMVQGGPNIIDTILLSATRRAQFYNPDVDTFSYQRSDVLTGWKMDWRFLFTHMAWTDHEIEMNVGSISDGKARTLKIKDLYKKLEMDCMTDLVDTIEDTAWAAPSITGMETPTGKEPSSVLLYVNEGTAGSGELPKDAQGTAWGTNTVQRISSTTYSNWLPVRASYAERPKAGWDLFPALSQAFHKCAWQAMPYRGELSSPTQVSDMSIFCSLNGLTNYEEGLRVNQDQFKNGSTGQDPHYGMPTFRGRPLVYVQALDGAAVWPTGSSGALAAETTTTNSNAGPRYIGLNNKHIKAVWHSSRYMVKKPVLSPESQPFTNAVPMDTWFNRVCTSRRAHFCVYPSATLS